jgi:hypothetical protein
MVTPVVEDDQNLCRVNFPTSVPLIIVREVSYFCHNLRSAMDYMATALVSPNPQGHNRNPQFPLFWDGVWDETPQGKPAQKTKARNNWERYTAGMPPKAITILKGLQPQKAARNTPTEIYRLFALYELWNEDKHRQLPTIEPGIFNCKVLWTNPDGQRTWTRFVPEATLVKDNAAFVIPDTAMDVEVSGSVDVAVRLAEPKGYVPLVGYFENVLRSVRELVIDPLHPIAAGIP